MDNAYSLTPDSLRTYNRWHWLVALALLVLLLVLPWMFGIGPNSWRDCLPAAAPVAAAPTPAPAVVPAPVARAPVAPVAAALPTARVYFALDRVEPPVDIDRTLADVVTYMKAHPDAKALLSGFHDPRGSAERNADLALNRARTVRTAMQRAEIAVERIVMNKPQVTTGTGSNEEARRVEVTIQP